MKNSQTTHLAGKLLVAMPSMSDSRFHRAVIFVCAHDDQGAMGLVINQKMPGMDFQGLVKKLKFQSDVELKFDDIDLPVMRGGPVDPARGSLLHSGDFTHPETLQVGDMYGVTGTIDALHDVANGGGPENILLVLGYAGWDSGQLDVEIQENAWLVVDAESDLVFDCNFDGKWTGALSVLGVDPALLSVSAGRA